MGYGRWKCVLLTNIFVIGGSFITIFYTNYPVLLIGRFFYGISAGAFNVFCPKMVSEMAPKEINGPAGAMFQILVTLGILVPSLISLAFGKEYSNGEAKTQVYINFAMPIALGVIHIFLLLFVYPFDTPNMMKEKNEDMKLRTFFAKLYDPSIIEERIAEINVAAGNDVSDLPDVDDDKTYKSAFCSPQYSMSTFVGISLAIFQ